MLKPRKPPAKQAERAVLTANQLLAREAVTNRGKTEVSKKKSVGRKKKVII